MTSKAISHTRHTGTIATTTPISVSQSSVMDLLAFKSPRKWPNFQEPKLSISCAALLGFITEFLHQSILEGMSMMPIPLTPKKRYLDSMTRRLTKNTERESFLEPTKLSAWYVMSNQIKDSHNAN